MATAGTTALMRTCIVLGEAMAAARDPWWIIGSAAVALHGADAGMIGDVDVVLSVPDAHRLCAMRDVAIGQTAAHPLFRSRLFARWTGTPLAIELMAGFEVATADGWHPVNPVSRQRIETGGATVYVPVAGELIALLRLFGRRKDLTRAAALARSA